MAHLWSDDGHGRWASVELLAPPHATAGGTLLRSGDSWVLVGDPGLRVNGTALLTGIRVLRDRDEISADGRRSYFSTESLAVIAPYGGAAAVACPRCRLDIEPGLLAVACPNCGVLHHQCDELPCWTYAMRCATCDQNTALDAELRWTPEAL